MSSSMLSTAERALLQDAIKRGHRQDSRGWLGCRQTMVIRGLIKSGWGSSRVTMGNTDLVVGVKVEVVDENSGSIKIEIEGNSTSTDLDRIQTRLEDILGGSLDRSALVVAPGRVFCIHVDGIIFHDDGNLPSALGLAIHTALRDMTFPQTRAIVYQAPSIDHDQTGDGDFGMKGLLKARGKKLRRKGEADTTFELDHSNQSEPRALGGVEHFPIMVNIAVMSPSEKETQPDILYLDPTSAEEEASDANLLVASTPDSGVIHGISLSTNKFLTIQTLLRAVQLGQDGASEMNDAMGAQAANTDEYLSTFLTT